MSYRHTVHYQSKVWIQLFVVSKLWTGSVHGIRIRNPVRKIVVQGIAVIIVFFLNCASIVSNVEYVHRLLQA